jgi:hypothetical protein
MKVLVGAAGSRLVINIGYSKRGIRRRATLSTP